MEIPLTLRFAEKCALSFNMSHDVVAKVKKNG